MPPPEKSSLSIRLTEPVVTLRSTPEQASRHHDDGILPPAVVRGLLTFQIAKPTKISSIELKLQAKATTHYVQGGGPTRIDVTERYQVHSASAVVFKAGPMPQAQRRATSTKPRVLFLDDRIGSGAHTAFSGVGGKRSASLDPQSSRANQPPCYDNGSGVVTDRTSLDSVPPYPSLANQQHFLRPDSVGARSRSIASTSRSPVLSLSNLTHEDPYNSSSSSLPSVREIVLSRTSSTEEVPEDESDPSALGPGDVAYYGLSRIPTGSSHRSSEQDYRGRSRSRFSLGKVVHVFEAVKERVRSQSPPADSRHRSNDSEERGRSLRKGKGKAQVSADGVAAHTISPSAISESGDGWVVFSEGTYTFPIIFTIPNDSPPTIKAERASLTWKIKAEVKRPSAFKSNLAVEKEVIVVRVPKGDDAEEVDGIDLQRDWNGQFQYRVQIAGRGVPVGGKIPFRLTITPLAKAKVHCIMVHLDERTEYYTRGGSRVQSDAIKRANLLVIRHNNSNQRYGEPILPLASDELNVFRKSPLYRFMRPEEDESEVASSFVGAGPWTITHQLPVPDSCSILHPSNRTKRSNVMVDHTLKIVLRVEKEDEYVKNGRKRLYDIVIQTPIQILSCHCTSEWTLLPRYDDVPRWKGDSSEDTSRCPCRARRQAKSRTDSQIACTLPGASECATSAGAHSDPSQLHEWLMSGLVSERGEAPPSYERYEQSEPVCV